MTAPVQRDFANIERLLAAVCAPLLGGAQFVGSRTPEDLDQVEHYLWIVRVDGARTALYDYPIVDISYLRTDGDERAGQRMASTVVNHLLSKPAPHPAIDSIACDPGPREVPWGDSDTVRRWAATLFCQTRQVRLTVLP